MRSFITTRYCLLIGCVALLGRPAMAKNMLLAQSTSPAALAACGPQTARIDRRQIPAPQIQAGPAPGKALVYFFTDADQSFGPPTVRIGINGAWAGATYRTSFAAINVDPGEQHICTSMKVRWVGTMVALNRLNAQAGKTYYFTTLTLNDWHAGTAFFLNRTDPAEAALLLQRARDQARINSAPLPKNAFARRRRIQLMTTFSSPQKAVTTPSAMAACGPSRTRYAVSRSGSLAGPNPPSPGKARLYFLLDSHTERSIWRPRGPVVNVGVDGAWSGALPGKSYLPVDVPPGKHDVCLEHLSRWYGRFLQLRSLDVAAGKTYYINTMMLSAYDMNGDEGPNAFVVTRVNPAEGRLLVETSALSVSRPKPAK